MRLAFFSPLPPARSGIADYSEALLGPLRGLADIDVFSARPAVFDASRYDLCLYQVGNNADHAFVYEMALAHPGVVVLHEANLHHLIAEITIKRGAWDAYLAEAEYDGGGEALEYARRVKALDVGPDYEGLPMTRRLLERSRALIVHSHYVESILRTSGFAGPAAVIPHGAWIPEADRNAYRYRLGIDETIPLIGIFGFLKPYKRIAECLRAFRRLVHLEPRAKMILAGEVHPDFPVRELIRTLDLGPYIRLLGYTGGDDFTGYLAACDIVLNLRYPTVGETSGTLLRALGLGRAALVSDVGSFHEYPDSVCLKIPIGPGEEDAIFDCLNTLVSRPEAARALGSQAKSWVQRECTWDKVARRYVNFLEAVTGGRTVETVPAMDRQPQPPETAVAPLPEAAPDRAVDAGYIIGWIHESDARAYAGIHLDRLVKTLDMIPPGSPADRILEMGAYLQITPALKTRLHYGEVRGCYLGPAGRIDHREVTSAEGEKFVCDVDHFDAERAPFPYADEHFATVLCCELIEHLFTDPMHMVSEVNRILRTGGHFLLTTPNISSLRAISAILQGYHPGFFPAYLRPSKEGEAADARHNREYTPHEIRRLLLDGGFEVVRLETGPFREEAHPELGWVLHLLDRYQLSPDLRGEGIYALGRKSGPVRVRYPDWLYAGGA